MACTRWCTPRPPTASVSHWPRNAAARPGAPYPPGGGCHFANHAHRVLLRSALVGLCSRQAALQMSDELIICHLCQAYMVECMCEDWMAVVTVTPCLLHEALCFLSFHFVPFGRVLSHQMAYEEVEAFPLAKIFAHRVSCTGNDHQFKVFSGTDEGIGHLHR